MTPQNFHPELSPEDNALIYGITGGVPHYINKLDVRHSIKDALLENFFDTSAYLFEEPENLLKQELRGCVPNEYLVLFNLEHNTSRQGCGGFYMAAMKLRGRLQFAKDRRFCGKKCRRPGSLAVGWQRESRLLLGEDIFLHFFLPVEELASGNAVLIAPGTFWNAAGSNLLQEIHP